MKNRRILSHPELEAPQIRSVDPFSDFDSDIVNRLTKISHSPDQEDVIIEGLDVVENCSDNIEYLSQELINYDRFQYTGNIHRVIDSIDGKVVNTSDFQVYILDNDDDGIINAYIKQDLGINNNLDFKRLIGSDVTRTFAVSFALSQGSPKNLYFTIGDTVHNLKYLDGAYDNKTNRYTIFLDVNFKNIYRKLYFTVGVHLDIRDNKNFFTHDELNGASFLTISDISCKMVIRDKSNEIPFYVNHDKWNYNHTHVFKKLRVTEGTAVKDNVVINALESVNVGNSAVVLNLDNEKSWIHNNPYTLHDFYNGNTNIFNIKTNVYGNPNLRIISNNINEYGDLEVAVENINSKEIRTFSVNDFNNVSDNEITFRVISENNDVVNFSTYGKLISDDFCGNTMIVSYKNHILTKIDIHFTTQYCPQIPFSISKKDIEKYQIADYNDIKVTLSDAVVKVDRDSPHVLWGYVVCYYSYFKNPNPNRCYIGLIRESDFIKTGYTEDYLILAKVRFIDPKTIDLVQYLPNRNNYAKLNVRQINYIVNFDFPCIWYTNNPVNITDAINYCEVVRNNVLKRFTLKHNYQAPVSTSYSIINKDAATDVKGRVLVDLQIADNKTAHHLQRRIAPDTRKLKIYRVYDPQLGIESDEYTFTWDILRSKWLTENHKWAISDNFSTFGLFSESTNTIHTKYFGFNSVGPFKFIDPRTSNIVVEVNWDYSSFNNIELPHEVNKFDISGDESLLVCYNPVDYKDNDSDYIPEDEVANSYHNHFSYIIFRKQYLSKKYLVKLLDLLPAKPEYLIDGRILESIDGHIQSSVHALSLNLIDKNVLTAEVLGNDNDYNDIIKSTTYWFSDNNFKTKGNNVAKPFQDDHVLVCDQFDEDRKEIQSDNYIIDSLKMGYILISETDKDGVIHIKSSINRFSNNMTNNNMVIGKVFDDPKYQLLDTDRYYISTTNKRTNTDSSKLLQDKQLLLANKDNINRTAIESSNVVVDEPLVSKHVLISEEDSKHVIHIKSTKAQIDDNLHDSSFVTTKDVTLNNETIATDGYGIIPDSNLNDNQFIRTNSDGSKHFESCGVIFDFENLVNITNDPYIKVTKRDLTGQLHICNSDETAQSIQSNYWFKPSNITILDNKIHITIDYKKNFRITTSQLISAVQNNTDYLNIFNLNLSSKNSKLFTVVVHIDITNNDIDNVDRSSDENKSFNVISNYNESRLLFINDIDLNYVVRHIVTETNRRHVVFENTEMFKHLICEGEKSKSFRSYIEMEYLINSNTKEVDVPIYWSDEYRGYNDELLTIKTSSDDIDENDISPTESEDIDFKTYDASDDIDDDNISTTQSDDINLDVYGSSDDINMDVYGEGKLKMISDDIMVILGSIMTMYPAIINYDKLANYIENIHGFGRARCELKEIFAQTKSCITFKLVKQFDDSQTKSLNLIPGITFDTDNVSANSIFAESETFNMN